MALLAVAAGLVLLIWVLHRTGWYWLPGAGVLIAGVVLAATHHPDKERSTPAIMAAGFARSAGLLLMLVGLLGVVVALALAHRRRPVVPPAPPVGPPGTVVNSADDVSKT